MLLIYDYEKQHFAPWLLKSNILVWLVNAKNLAKAPSSMGGNWRASRRIIIIKWLQLLFFFPSAYSHGSQLQSTLLQKRSSCVVQAVCRKKASRLIYWFGQLMIGAFFIDWLNTPPPPLHLAITITNKPAAGYYSSQCVPLWNLTPNNNEFTVMAFQPDKHSSFCMTYFFDICECELTCKVLLIYN